MGYDSIAWLPLAAGLTVLGMVLSYLTWRRRGARPAIRVAAWSLLPIAAYLTGAIEMLWKIGAAIGDFGAAFVFSPAKWAGIAVAGLAFVLLVVTSNKARRKAKREQRRVAPDRKNAAGSAAAPPGVTAGSAATSVVPTARTPVTAKSKTPAKGSGRTAAPLDDDDDLKDIEEILRKRGI